MNTKNTFTSLKIYALFQNIVTNEIIRVEIKVILNNVSYNKWCFASFYVTKSLCKSYLFVLTRQYSSIRP